MNSNLLTYYAFFWVGYSTIMTIMTFAIAMLVGSAKYTYKKLSIHWFNWVFQPVLLVIIIGLSFYCIFRRRRRSDKIYLLKHIWLYTGLRLAGDWESQNNFRMK